MAGGGQAPSMVQPNQQPGTPVGQQPTNHIITNSFGSQGFNSPQQQYQPSGGYGMNQSYGSPFGGMGGYGMNQGYGSPFGGYGSPFGGGYGSPFGGGYGSPFGGMGGYGSPFGGGFNPYAQQPMRGGLNPYTTDYKPKPVFDNTATPQEMGQPNPFSNTAIQNQQVNGPIAGQPVRGGFNPYTTDAKPLPGFGPGVNNFSMANVKPSNPAIGGLGGLAAMLQGGYMYNKGGKVDE